jgi:acetyltransferase-like isoleucine patch superfamily enzyme
VIYAGSVIGSGLRTGHGVMLREDNEIGDDVSIGTHSIVEHHVRLGNGVRIHSNAFVPEYSVVEDRAWIGPSVTFTNALYPLSAGAKAGLEGPVIRSGAKIGANATLLPGVVVGADALVGAGSVVVHDVPAGAVVVGNPARVVRQVSEIDAYRAQQEMSG